MGLEFYIMDFKQRRCFELGDNLFLRSWNSLPLHLPEEQLFELMVDMAKEDWHLPRFANELDPDGEKFLRVLTREIAAFVRAARGEHEVVSDDYFNDEFYIEGVGSSYNRQRMELAGSRYSETDY